MCVSVAPKYAYMGIVATVHLCGEFLIVETLELSFVPGVDFFSPSPRLHLTVMFVVLF